MKLKNLLKVLITGSVTMILTACYGIVAPSRFFNGKFTLKDKKDQTIPDLKISFQTAIGEAKEENWSDAGVSDENGEFEYGYELFEDESLYFKVEDVDGSDNYGDFKTVEFEAVEKEESEETIITLEEK